MYEHFEHTADLGLRVQAEDLNSLFQQAGVCLFAAMLDNISDVLPARSVQFEVPGTARDDLLFDWLRALLQYADQERLVFGHFDVLVQETGLKAVAWGEPLDRARHHLSREVKAITYHELKVEQHNNGWLAEVIIDI